MREAHQREVERLDVAHHSCLPTTAPIDPCASKSSSRTTSGKRSQSQAADEIRSSATGAGRLAVEDRRDGSRDMCTVDEWAPLVDQPCRSDRGFPVARDQLHVEMVHRTVAHRDEVDAFHSRQRLCHGAGDVAAQCEQCCCLGLVQFGEVVPVRLPHHDGVPGRSWIERQYSFGVLGLHNDVLLAEDGAARVEIPALEALTV